MGRAPCRYRRADLHRVTTAEGRITVTGAPLAIKDQIMILLGGLGDESVVESIIQAMATPAEAYSSPDAKKINLIANIALTNITVSEVIWHHGGGIHYDRCQDDPKSCWEAWWAQNKDTFRVTLGTLHRRYSNYPNYGVYLQQ